MKDFLPKFRVAAIQASSVLLDLDATTNKACELIRKAANQEARLAVFPECFMPGYPMWLDFYTATHKKALMLYKRLFGASVEIPGREINLVCNTARDNNMTVVMGVCERKPKTTGTLYNSQVFIDNHGKILGVHRKLVPTIKERIVHSQGYGAMLQVYETELGRIGGLICGENSNPLAKFALMAQGEMIHAASWPAYFSSKRMSEIIEFVSRALAYESKVFVINAAGVLDESNLSTIEANIDELPNKNIYASAGGSSIIAPSGDMVAGPLPAKEEILCSEIDLNDIIAEKMFHDFAGHYNRFDVFSLHVNNRIQSTVEIDNPITCDTKVEGDDDGGV
jgi:nitrilase